MGVYSRVKTLDTGTELFFNLTQKKGSVKGTLGVGLAALKTVKLDRLYEVMFSGRGME